VCELAERFPEDLIEHNLGDIPEVGDGNPVRRVPDGAARLPQYTPPIDVLVLCTANICRSPVGAALVARELVERGVAARVRSAGRLRGGWPTTPENIEVMRSRGVDLSAHRSTEATAALVAEASLVLGMAREHVRDALALDPDVWPRVFTLKELVRRGEAIGARSAGDTLPAWLARAAADRDISTMLGSSPEDDVADPMGESITRYEDTADKIAGLVTRLAELAWPSEGLPAASGWPLGRRPGT
jgi:protein-tyrosine phosphatase